MVESVTRNQGTTLYSHTQTEPYLDQTRLYHEWDRPVNFMTSMLDNYSLRS